MVNAEKHEKITAKYGMLPVEDKELMQKLNVKILYTAINDSKFLIDELDGLYNELKSYYDLFNGTNAGVLKVGLCQRILEIYEWAFVIKNTIQYNYHVLPIKPDVVKSILNLCDNVLSMYDAIKTRQNKNIDNKTFGGFYGVSKSKSINNTDVPKELFENVIRLKEPIFI